MVFMAQKDLWPLTLKDLYVEAHGGLIFDSAVTEPYKKVFILTKSVDISGQNVSSCLFQLTSWSEKVGLKVFLTLIF